MGHHVRRLVVRAHVQRQRARESRRRQRALHADHHLMRAVNIPRLRFVSGPTRTLRYESLLRKMRCF